MALAKLNIENRSLAKAKNLALLSRWLKPTAMNRTKQGNSLPSHLWDGQTGVNYWL
jgi:hypothetical protein